MKFPFKSRTKSWGSKKAGLDMAEDKLGGPLKQCHDVMLGKFLNIWLFIVQNCDTQELRVVTSRSGYPKKRTLHLTEDFCLIVSKMRKICQDEGRKKAFEDYYADLHNLHPLADKCNIVLGMFVLSLLFDQLWDVIHSLKNITACYLVMMSDTLQR